MPPKKKEEEIDLSSLPPYNLMTVRLLPKTRAQLVPKIVDTIAESRRSFFKVVSRDEILNWAKEKGLYADQNAITEKMRKDKNFAEMTTEVTPELLANSLHGLVNETVANGRKLKKEIADLVAAGKDPSGLVAKQQGGASEAKSSKAPPGKAGAKGAKGVAKDEDQPQAEFAEREFEKALDFIYFIENYPSTQEEAKELNKTGFAFTCTLVINPKEMEPAFDSESLIEAQQNPENFEEDMRRRLEAFMNENTEQNEATRPVGVAPLKPEDQEQIGTIEQQIQLYKEIQKNASPNSLIRQHVFLEVDWEYRLGPEEEVASHLRELTEKVFEMICSLSVDFEIFFKKWLPSKKKVPLNRPPPPGPSLPKETEEIQKPPKSQSDQRRPGSKEVPNKKGQAPPAKGKKGVLPAEQKKKEEPEEQKTVAPVPVEAKKEEPIRQDIYDLQLSSIELEHLGAGAILEAMLDQLVSDKEGVLGLRGERPKDISTWFEREFDSVFEREEKKETEHWSLSEMEGMSTPTQKIIEENDSISVRSLNECFSTGEPTTAREKALFAELRYVPGLDRLMMPKEPEKEEKMRKAEKSQILSFCSVPVLVWEHQGHLAVFEKMIERETLPQKWNFDRRIYVEKHTKNTLVQALFEALLQDQLLITKYNDLEDALHVVAYFKKPQGSMLYNGWRNPFQVIPNFELWLQHFKSNTENLQREVFFDMEYDSVGVIQEKTQLLYPADDSVWLASLLEIGGKKLARFRVLKEGFTLGLRPSITESGGEIWVQFANGSRMIVENEKYPVDAQKKGGESPKKKKVESLETIENPHSPNHSSFEEEAPVKGESKTEPWINEANAPEGKPRIAISYTLPFGLLVRFLPNGDIFQTIDWKGRREKKSEESSSTAVNYSTSLELEAYRIISGKGTVIRYMKNGTIQTMFANGSTGSCKKNGMWTSVNSKGVQRLKRINGGSVSELEPIGCSIKVDPETNNQIINKEDGTLIIKFTDGSVLTRHADGTRMSSSSDGSLVTIEHPEFATVKIKVSDYRRRNPIKIGLGSSFAGHGYKDLLERSCDGKISETALADGTVVQGLRELRELEGYNNSKNIQVWLLRGRDQSVFKFEEDGECVFIGSRDRAKLTREKLEKVREQLMGETVKQVGEKGSRSNEGSVIKSNPSWLASDNEAERNKKMKELSEMEYWMQLFLPQEERLGGVLTGNVLTGELSTIDADANRFCLYSDGRVRTRLAVSLSLDEASQPKPPQNLEGYWYPPENNDLPLPKSSPKPRLFLVRNDNTGEEFLEKDQISYYKAQKLRDAKCTILTQKTQEGAQKELKSISYITQVLPKESKASGNNRNKGLPNTAVPPPQTDLPSDNPIPAAYLWRSLLKFPKLDESDRQRRLEETQKYQEWKQKQERKWSEYSFRKRTDEEKEEEYIIQQKILSLQGNSKRSNF